MNKKPKKFKLRRQAGLFDKDIRLSKISTLGDPLEVLSDNVDFELFRPILEGAITNGTLKGEGGRPPYDYVLMFKILVLQRIHNLSDDQTEYQINDRLSFMRFLSLTEADDVPDTKTIWKFREQLAQLNLVESLFKHFLKELDRLGMILNEGRIVDASFVQAPRQRNSKADNESIKEGKRPEKFDENLSVGRQKDTDARWTKKNNETHYGYKNHIKSDSLSKFILAWFASAANLHDSQAVEKLLDETDKGQSFHADSAYSGEPIAKQLEDYGLENQVHEKGKRGRPLSEDQKARNKEKSGTRARVEHIFGTMSMQMKGQALRCIGIIRAENHIGFSNLCYNMLRLCTLSTQKSTSIMN